MNFFKAKKYSILSKLLKYSFVVVIAAMVILPTLFVKVEAEVFPKITSISPTEGNVGTEVIISGENLTGSSGLSGVYFGTTRAVPTENNTTEIKVKVPVTATDGLITVKMFDGTMAVSGQNFRVTTTNVGTGTSTATTPGTTANTSPTPSTVSGQVKWNGLVPECNSGVIDPKTKNYSNACDFNMVILIINNVINFLLVTLATPLFALILVYVGWLYLSDMGSSENITHAKKILKNAVIGYVIALAAWLIVKTILTSLGFKGETFLG